MASNILLIVLFALVSFSLTSGYSLSTRDVVSKQEDESSYVMATNDQGSSMIVPVKARRLLALAAASKVVVNKAVSKSSSSKCSKKRKHKKNETGSLDSEAGSRDLDVSALVGIIIGAIVVTILIMCVVYFFYRKHKTKKAQSIEQE